MNVTPEWHKALCERARLEELAERVRNQGLTITIGDAIAVKKARERIQVQKRPHS